MKTKKDNKGFSLTEVMMAVGILAVGFIFIAGVFPVGIHFTTIATERTIAAVVADEAFAKIKLYGVNPVWLSSGSTNTCNYFNDVSSVPLYRPSPVYHNEFAYPSAGNDPIAKQYYWSALCRLVKPTERLVQVTVFVSRKVGAKTTYVGWAGDWPVPMKVEVNRMGANNEIFPTGAPGVGVPAWLHDGCTIMDDATGKIYRVLERDVSVIPNRVVLDRPWQGGSRIWVVPPPVGGGRAPCIAVYQEDIRF